MKTSIFVSTVFAISVCASYVNAYDVVPESPRTIKECHIWAESQKGTDLYPHANRRCDALKNCIANESTGELQLRECMTKAESQFLNASNMIQPQLQSGAHQLETDAITTSAGSFYERNGDGKGFRNATEGN